LDGRRSHGDFGTHQADPERPLHADRSRTRTLKPQTNTDHSCCIREFLLLCFSVFFCGLLPVFFCGLERVLMSQMKENDAGHPIVTGSNFIRGTQCQRSRMSAAPHSWLLNTEQKKTRSPLLSIPIR